MLLSRARPMTASSLQVGQRVASGQQSIQLSDLLDARDFLGAIAFIQHEKRSGREDLKQDLWLAYCHFHLGDLARALDTYESRPSETLNACVCLFYLGQFQRARELALTVQDSPLLTRLLVHVQLKLEERAVDASLQSRLSNSIEDQLSLAACHFARAHYQEAIDIYKKLLLEHKHVLALHVYIALCYHKLDYYDVSQEVLQQYLARWPESIVARNLKACNHFRLFDAKQAELELRDVIDTLHVVHTLKQLVRHNLVVFRNGESALQVWPQMLELFPEARLNLAIFHLKNDQLPEADALLKELPENGSAHELILRAVVSALLCQQPNQDRDQLRHAQQCFQKVGQSASECDTIQGRQAMSECFFLLKQFEDVCLYLSSIKSYFYSDDVFAANFGQAKAATGHYREAEQLLEQIQSERMRSDSVLQTHLLRCYVLQKKPEKAWSVIDQSAEGSPKRFHLLQLMANDCYRMGEFLHAARAFDQLCKLDQSNAEFWEGKRGAVAGVVQMVVAKKENKEAVQEVLKMLRNSQSAQSSQMITVIKNYCKEL